MRQKYETATSFNQLKEITQIMYAQKASVQNSLNINETVHKEAPKPKGATRAKNHALNPTKKAFSERQKTTIRDKSQASANKRQEIKQANHANAFKSDEAKERGQR